MDFKQVAKLGRDSLYTPSRPKIFDKRLARRSSPTFEEIAKIVDEEIFQLFSSSETIA